MSDLQQKSLTALLRHHAAGNDLPRLPQIAFADTMARGDDPLHILPYFADTGAKIANLEDLLAACTDPSEEEIEANRVEDGVAVHLAVDGQWLVFTK